MPTVTVQYKGNFFKMPQATVRRAITGAVQELVEYGEQRLDERLQPRPAGVYLAVTPKGQKWGGPGTSRPGRGSVGNYRRNIHGRVSGLNGRIDDGNVVYGPWLEGTGSRNQTTRFKGYHSFRTVYQSMEKHKGKVIKAHVQRAVQELNR